MNTSEDPVRASAVFYYELSAIHPFYDANGRIGRLIVSLYLYRFGYRMDWQTLLENQNTFLKKLNHCIKRRETNASTLNRYINYLVRFWTKYVHRIDPETDEVIE